MSTYAQEMREKHPNRPYVSRPNWELLNIKKALNIHKWLNTSEETQRLLDVTAELTLSAKRT